MPMRSISAILAGQCFIGLACFGVLVLNTFGWTPPSSWFDKVPLPLSDTTDTSALQDGSVVVGLKFFRRVHVYDRDGRFSHGFFVSDPRLTSLYVDADHVIHTWSSGTRCESRYTVNGQFLGRTDLAIEQWERALDASMARQESLGITSSASYSPVLPQIEIRKKDGTKTYIRSSFWAVPVAPLIAMTVAVLGGALRLLPFSRRQSVRLTSGELINLPSADGDADNVLRFPGRYFSFPEQIFLGTAVLMTKGDLIHAGRNVWDPFITLCRNDLHVHEVTSRLLEISRIELCDSSGQRIRFRADTPTAERIVQFLQKAGAQYSQKEESRARLILKVIAVVGLLALLFASWPTAILLYVAVMLTIGLWCLLKSAVFVLDDCRFLLTRVNHRAQTKVLQSD